MTNPWRDQNASSQLSLALVLTWHNQDLVGIFAADYRQLCRSSGALISHTAASMLKAMHCGLIIYGRRFYKVYTIGSFGNL